MDKELNDLITRFTDQMRSQYSGDSFAAGYFAAWIRQLTYTMESYKHVA